MLKEVRLVGVCRYTVLVSCTKSVHIFKICFKLPPGFVWCVVRPRLEASLVVRPRSAASLVARQRSAVSLVVRQRSAESLCLSDWTVFVQDHFRKLKD